MEGNNLKKYHSEYLSPINDSITENLEKNSSIVRIDYIEWYWDCINDYIMTKPDAFGSIFLKSTIVQLPYTISYSHESNGDYNKDLLRNELKYLIELDEILNAYMYRHITKMGKEELKYIQDSLEYLHLIKSHCIKILLGDGTK